MHAAACQFVKKALAEHGEVTGDVVEFGSRDANGGVRQLFPLARSYLGIDTHSGKGVDLVQDAGLWRAAHGYACVISTETLEHTANWRALLRAGASALAPDGIMIITCASGSRPRHSATIPHQPPEPGEYYANVRPEDFRQAAESFGLQVNLVANQNDLYAVCRLPPPDQASGIRVIGAGMWRTGTVSLKSALEKLTGQPCHHMTELLRQPYQVNGWLQLMRGARPRWPELLRGYGSTLDWPSLAYWRELYQAYPRALVLLSARDPEDWWESASQTVLQSAPTPESAATPWDRLILDLFEHHFVGRSPSRQQAIEAYRAHNQLVRATVTPNRLLEWTPADGWLPLCRALAVPAPTSSFPLLNTRADYQRHHKLEQPSAAP